MPTIESLPNRQKVSRLKFLTQLSLRESLRAGKGFSFGELLLVEQMLLGYMQQMFYTASSIMQGWTSLCPFDILN